MREFFKGWRRKAGCVTLVMACVLMSVWFRSLVFFDYVDFTTSDRQHEVFSIRGSLSWSSWDLVGPRTEHRQTEWGGSTITDDLIVLALAIPDDARPSCWTAPYWSFAVPLMLLSAYLILWNPRKKQNPSPPQTRSSTRLT